MKLPIYLDYSATTPVDPRVAGENDAVPDHGTGPLVTRPPVPTRFGWQAEEAVDIARNQIAELVGADPRRNRLYLWCD
ncbi:cysteine desulfurase [Klebsiella pneumoniae subsp. rhinoscleromatis]|nr:cysteine desulfurase [Klebsiella pneumoniae subsp. rhinoscleromatis]